MSRPTLSVAWYRFRSTFGDRWGGYLAIVLLVGLVGGLALGAVAAARRTQAAFPAYLASTNSSDLTVLTGYSGFDPTLIRKIAALPHVRQMESYARLDAAILAPNGAVAVNALGLQGSIDGEYFNQDRVTIVQGRMANPNRADEAVIDAKGTPSQLRVGEVIPFGFYTNAEEELPDFGKPGIKPYLRIDVKVVGKAVFSQEVVQDDNDTGVNAGALFTPALTRQLAQCCANVTESAIQLDGGSREVAAAEASIEPATAEGLSRLLLRHLRHRGQGRTGHRARVDRPGGLRGDRRPGRPAYRRPGYRPAATPGRRRPRHATGPRGGPGRDDQRRAARRSGRRRRRLPAGGRRGRRAIAAGATGFRARRVSLPRHRLRLDRAGRGCAGADRCPVRGGRGAGLPAGPPSPGFAAAADPGPGIDRGPYGIGIGPATFGRRGRPPRPRSWHGTQRGTGTVRHPGRRAGHDRHDRHGHVRREPRYSRLAPCPVRMELDLRAVLLRKHSLYSRTARGGASRP